jgi:acetyl-CoA decarbonylase/synthase complex subunit alpha
VESQIVQLVAATHTGQEGDNIDFESKTFHAGMLDHVALEVADISQISALGLPKGEPETALTDLGYGSIDASKPVIMCIGHNVLPSIDIIDYLMDHDLFGQIEVGGLKPTTLLSKITTPMIMALSISPITSEMAAATQMM